jgi:hypothetical protein
MEPAPQRLRLGDQWNPGFALSPSWTDAAERVISQAGPSPPKGRPSCLLPRFAAAILGCAPLFFRRSWRCGEVPMINLHPYSLETGAALAAAAWSGGWQTIIHATPGLLGCSPSVGQPAPDTDRRRPTFSDIPSWQGVGSSDAIRICAPRAEAGDHGSAQHRSGAAEQVPFQVRRDLFGSARSNR